MSPTYQQMTSSPMTCCEDSSPFSLERLVLGLLKHLATRFGDAIDSNYIILHVLQGVSFPEDNSGQEKMMLLVLRIQCERRTVRLPESILA